MNRTEAIVEVTQRWINAWQTALAENKDPRDMIDNLQSEFILMKLIAIHGQQQTFDREFFDVGATK